MYGKQRKAASKKMEQQVCASCPSRSTQRTTITCGSCKRRWNALCVRVPAKKARERRGGGVWYCRDCLGHGPHTQQISSPTANPAADNFPETLAKMRRKERIVSRLPKAIRRLVADALAEALDGAILSDSTDRWWELLTFAHR